MPLQILGHPLVELVLYFFIYAALGWVMETTYCSIKERRLVARGFLYGPLCPIYGVGVLLMILFFAPLADNLPLFYVVSTATMSAWEYAVAWFLETTTQIKYWDYSDSPLNLQGRICLWVSLTWGVLSYVAIFWIHPPVAAAVAAIPPHTRSLIATALLAVLAVDAGVTIRQLALVTMLIRRLETLRAQLTASTDELGERVEQAVTDRLEAVAATLASAVPERVSESAERLRARYNELLAMTEHHSRRLRRVYSGMTSRFFSERLEEIREKGAELASLLKGDGKKR